MNTCWNYFWLIKCGANARVFKLGVASSVALRRASFSYKKTFKKRSSVKSGKASLE